LMKDLHYWKSRNLDIVGQVAMLHHRLVQIHPFYNGNGRWARMCSNIWLFRHDGATVQWPENLIGGASPVRGEYLSALRMADDGDIEPFVALHRRFITTS
jgi:Fic family protein